MKININLDEIDDGLSGRWWHYIRAKDLAFQERIPDQKSKEVENDDVFIHKEIKEGDKFPTIRYHIIMDGDALEMDGKFIRNNLSKKLLEFIKENKKYPFAITFKKIQKNGLAIVKYNPADFNSFQLKFKLEDLEMEIEEKEMEKYLTNLGNVDENPLREPNVQTFEIEHITKDRFLEKSGSGSSLYVFDGKILKIDLRKSYYKEHQTIFYLFKIKGGKISSGATKSSFKKDFDIINIKCSEKALKKYKLKVGDIISFKGKYKDHPKLNIIIQNIRKFEKTKN